MRYALEIENCEQIIANDLDRKAVELIDINIELNKVNNLVKSNHGDCLNYMNTTSQDKSQLFDCIDLGKILLISRLIFRFLNTKMLIT
jgi:tRNA G26 N,N-dimethylase Trm1